MVSKVSLQRYISKCDEIISSGDAKAAEDLQKEIISVFSADLEHLKAGLSNYRVLSVLLLRMGRQHMWAMRLILSKIFLSSAVDFR